MKINEIDDNVIQGPWKKSNVTKGPWKNKEPILPQKLSITQAFGGREYSAMDEVGIKFLEKPGSFSYINRGGADGNRFVNVRQLKELEELIGRKLNSYNAYDILEFKPIKTPRGHTTGWTDHPETDADFSNLKQNDETFILWFPPGATEIDRWHSSRNKFSDIPIDQRYLVNRTGAQRYIRMWVALVD